ncbi:hypothetical protein LCGC14_2301870 [marine sediment metagenome]|uniref:Uncharacterized protein n=1 Tax=marine sediment metagenome TaxID=412755 RepID=A0A0F9FI88_9ZZZZ
MIRELPDIIMMESLFFGGSIQIPASESQQVEILKIKLNEVIRHINVLEEKLLSPDERGE